MYLNLEQIRAKIQGNYENEKKIEKAKKYYRVDNTIKKTGVRPKEDTKDPLRTANNKIPHNFHQILVDKRRLIYLLIQSYLMLTIIINLTLKFLKCLAMTSKEKLKIFV